jgi:membrane-associated protease RseP (regulator of RpoE activity)
VGGLGIFLFILMILGAIGLHEFGHFITAKKFGIKVERFFIGFGPKIWSVKKGDTEYGIAAIPAGGYVRIAGMNPYETIAPEDVPRTFKAKPAWQRAIVLAAGSTMHFILALVILVLMLTTVGLQERITTTVARVTPSGNGYVSPAAEAGIKPGDTIVAIDGMPVTDWDQMRNYIASHPGETINVVIDRKGQRIPLTVKLASETPPPERKKTGFLGVGPAYANVKRDLGSAIVDSGKLLGSGMWQSLKAFGNIFRPSSLGRLFSVAVGQEKRTTEDPTSIVGIGRVAGDFASRGRFADLFYLFVGFNIFIGVANLLPLPPLDGGHLAVLAWEKISRRDVDMRKLMPVTAFVVSILVTLFVLLLYLDIVRPLPTLPG